MVQTSWPSSAFSVRKIRLEVKACRYLLHNIIGHPRLFLRLQKTMIYCTCLFSFSCKGPFSLDHIDSEVNNCQSHERESFTIRWRDKLQICDPGGDACSLYRTAGVIDRSRRPSLLCTTDTENTNRYWRLAHLTWTGTCIHSRTWWSWLKSSSNPGIIQRNGRRFDHRWAIDADLGRALGFSYSVGVEQRAVAYPTPPPSNPGMDALLTENPDKSKVVQEVTIHSCKVFADNALIFDIIDRIRDAINILRCVRLHQT